MLTRTEQVQIPKYKTHAYKTPKTAHMSRQPCSNTQLSCEEGKKQANTPPPNSPTHRKSFSLQIGVKGNHGTFKRNPDPDQLGMAATDRECGKANIKFWLPIRYVNPVGNGLSPTIVVLWKKQQPYMDKLNCKWAS